MQGSTRETGSGTTGGSQIRRIHRQLMVLVCKIIIFISAGMLKSGRALIDLGLSGQHQIRTSNSHSDEGNAIRRIVHPNWPYVEFGIFDIKLKAEFDVGLSVLTCADLRTILATIEYVVGSKHGL